MIRNSTKRRDGYDTCVGRQSSRLFVLTLAIGIVLLAIGISHAAARAPSRVVIGCSTLGDGGRLTALKARPRNCGIAAIEGTMSGLRNVRWHDWRAARATGVGQLVDGLGFVHPAHFTAFARTGRDGVAFYSRLHVVSKSVRVRTGGCTGCNPYTREPGIDKTVNVTPWGLGCGRVPPCTLASPLAARSSTATRAPTSTKGVATRRAQGLDACRRGRGPAARAASLRLLLASSA
jgi:hypothetical protein